MKWMTDLRTAWTRNDGKPVDQWDGETDLRDWLLRSLTVVVGVAQMALIIHGLIRL